MSDEGLIVGIDLGTTYSLVSIMQGGKPIVLRNANGRRMTPSAVGVDAEGKVLVGELARARAATHPEQTALAFKRDMGVETEIQLGDRKFTPQMLSALVLRHLKEDAEHTLGQPVTEAVITVPAYFGERQRQATRDAAAIAGLKAERIINEPTAAAMAYGLHDMQRECTAVVLDLGGGTFDVTVLELIEGIIEVRATSGDARLGGEDFTDALAAQVERVALQDRAPEGRTLLDAVQRARLREACELAKKRLTGQSEVKVVVPGLLLADGDSVDLEHAVDRSWAEGIWQALIDRVRAPIMRALKDAELQPRDIDEVLLVGGSSRMPVVVQLAARLFGRMPSRGLPPDEAIAMGAAIQAALKRDDEAVSDLVVTDVAPFTLGIASTSEFMGQRVHDVFAPIIDRGTTVPCSREERFTTLERNQREIVIVVYQGEHTQCSRNTKLGEYGIKKLPNGAAGEVAIDVRFTYDLNGLLEVELSVVGTERKECLVIENRPGTMSPHQIEAARAAMKALKFHPRDSLPNKTIMARAEALFAELRGPERAQLGQMVHGFRAVLDSQDAAEITAFRADLNREIDRFQSW